MSKFMGTPKPWRVVQEKGGPVLVMADDDVTVCTPYGPRGPHHQPEARLWANANLLSAAHEMLDVLKGAIGSSPQITENGVLSLTLPASLHLAWLDAIAKAEGKS